MHFYNYKGHKFNMLLKIKLINIKKLLTKLILNIFINLSNLIILCFIIMFY